MSIAKMALKSKQKNVASRKPASPLGERIRAIREEADLTREDFAALTGVPLNTLVGYEVRGKDPSGSNLIKIAAQFKNKCNFLLLGK